MKPQTGDIWFNQKLNIHVVVMDADPDPRMAEQGWHRTLVLETNEYNWFITTDFPIYKWEKVA